MNRIIIIILLPIMMAFATAHGQNSMDYLDLGLKSTITRKKIEYFTSALELNPELSAVYEKRGLLYYFQGEYQKAISDYRKYLAVEAPNAEAFRMLGLAYLNTGFCDAGVSSFNSAIEIDSRFAAAFAGRAEAHRICGRYEKAILDATKAIDLGKDPTIRGDAYKTRARVYREIGRMDLSIADTKTIGMEDPRYPFLRFMSDSASLEDMRGIGLIGIICIAFVFIFGMKLKPPRKDD